MKLWSCKIALSAIAVVLHRHSTWAMDASEDSDTVNYGADGSEDSDTMNYAADQDTSFGTLEIMNSYITLYSKAQFQGDSVVVRLEGNNCYNLPRTCVSNVMSMAFEHIESDGGYEFDFDEQVVQTNATKIHVFTQANCTGDSVVFNSSAEASPRDLTALGLKTSIASFRVTGGRDKSTGNETEYLNELPTMEASCQPNTPSPGLAQWSGGSVVLYQYPAYQGASMTVKIDRPRFCYQVDPSCLGDNVEYFGSMQAKNMYLPRKSDLRPASYLRMYASDDCTGQYEYQVFGDPRYDERKSLEEQENMEFNAITRSILLEVDGAMVEEIVPPTCDVQAFEPKEASAKSGWHATFTFGDMDQETWEFVPGSETSYAVSKSQVCYNIGCIENNFTAVQVTGDVPTDGVFGSEQDDVLVVFFELADCSRNGRLYGVPMSRLYNSCPEIDPKDQSLHAMADGGAYASSFMIWETSAIGNGEILSDKCPTTDTSANFVPMAHPKHVSGMPVKSSSSSQSAVSALMWSFIACVFLMNV